LPLKTFPLCDNTVYHPEQFRSLLSLLQLAGSILVVEKGTEYQHQRLLRTFADLQSVAESKVDLKV
jgi:hypothetical protein